MLKNSFIKVLLLPIILLGLATTGFAFTPGETTDPNCAPGDINCDVDLSGISADNQELTFSGTSLIIERGNNVDLSNIDTNTQLTDIEVGAFGYIKTDSNTQLTEAEVDSFVSNNGYLTGTTDNQVLSLSGNILIIENGNNVDLGSLSTIDTDDQTLTLSGTTLIISEGNNVDLSGILPTNISDLSDVDTTGVLAGSTLYFDGTNWIALAKGTAGQSLAMNSGATAPEWIDGAISTTLDYISAYQTANTGNSGTIPFESADTGESFGITLNDGNDTFVIAKDGLYHIIANASIRADHAGNQADSDIQIIKNVATSNTVLVGSEVSTIEIDGQGSRSGDSAAMNVIATLAIGDTISLNNVSGNQAIRDVNITIRQLPTGTVVAAGDLPLTGGTGTNGQILSSNGDGTASFTTGGGGTFSSLTDTDVTGVLTGAVNYFDGTNWIDLPVGTAGQSLTVNAGATAPEWVTNSSTSIALHYAHSVGNVDASSTQVGAIPFQSNIVDDPFNMISGNTFVIQQAGRYRINGQTTTNTVNSSPYFQIRVNGIEQVSQRVNISAGDRFAWSVFHEMDLQVADIVDFNYNASETHYDRSFYISQVPNSTVVAAGDLPTNDQSASGYMDMGTMRMQWGRNSRGTVTLPQPFANTDYSVTATATDGTGGSGNNRTVHIRSMTNVSYFAEVYEANTGAAGSGVPFNWIAIGLKP